MKQLAASTLEAPKSTCFWKFLQPAGGKGRHRGASGVGAKSKCQSKMQKHAKAIETAQRPQCLIPQEAPPLPVNEKVDRTTRNRIEDTSSKAKLAKLFHVRCVLLLVPFRPGAAVQGHTLEAEHRWESAGRIRHVWKATMKAIHDSMM